MSAMNQKCKGHLQCCTSYIAENEDM